MMLGQQVPIPASPQEAILETIDNPYPDLRYSARFVAPEFTCLCKVTRAPDFATLIIDYVPHEHLIESKSLKLFLGSFRNYGAFHEDCTLMVGHRLAEAAKPEFIRVCGLWRVRGGIAIHVNWETGKVPNGVVLPELPKLEASQ